MSLELPVNDTDAAAPLAATAELMEEGLLDDNLINVSAVSAVSISGAPEAVSISGAPEATATATAIIEDYADESSNHIVSATAEPIQTASNTNAVTPAGDRAEFLSVTFMKKIAETILGIGLREQSDGSKFVAKLGTGGFLAQSPLRVGDKVLSINGKNCADFDRGATIQLLRQLVGTITIVAQNVGGNPKLVETMVEKPNVDSLVGIGVRRNARGSLEVSKVSAEGLFAHSLVNIGDRVISINNVGCNQMDAAQALDIIRNGPRYVILLTENQHEAAVVLAEAADHPGALELETAAATAIVGRENGLEPGYREHGYREQACFCIWLIISSLALMSVVIFTRSPEDR
jgi:membrane-associated protease RseP (regulator of RpoE activity)